MDPFSSVADHESAASSPPAIHRTRSSFRSLPPSPGSSAFGVFFSGQEEPRYFLDSCFLCKKPLGSTRDIFMYRGDMAFCSEECRQEQIEMDEAGEKSRKITAIRDQGKQTKPASAKAEKVHFRASTVVAG